MSLSVKALGINLSTSDRWIRLLRNPKAMVGLSFTLLIIALAILAPVLAPYSPSEFTGSEALQGPSASHWFGTDHLGRDVLSRTLWGSRTSLQASLLATGFALVVAVPIGLTGGYFRGPWDAVVVRLADTMLAFPFLVLAAGMAAIVGPSLTNAALAIGISQVPQIIRVTRGEALAIREQEYVHASVADGAGSGTILLRHVFPNTTNTLIVQGTLIVPFAIIAESILSFLGLGVQPPTPSWGVMLTSAQDYISQSHWVAIFPGLAIFIATISINLFGDGLRDSLDSRVA